METINRQASMIAKQGIEYKALLNENIALKGALAEVKEWFGEALNCAVWPDFSKLESLLSNLPDNFHDIYDGKGFGVVGGLISMSQYGPDRVELYVSVDGWADVPKTSPVEVALIERKEK
jgi:hypothetical protein